MTVYAYWDRRVVCEGTKEVCRKWIMDQAFDMGDGRKIFRSWEEDGEFVYDVGNLYFTYEDVFEADGNN